MQVILIITWAGNVEEVYMAFQPGQDRQGTGDFAGLMGSQAGYLKETSQDWTIRLFTI